MKKLIIFLLATSFSFIILAQDKMRKTDYKDFMKNLSVSALYQNGYVFGTNKFLRGTNIESGKINAFQAFSVRIAKQTTGDKLWEQLYQYPFFGLGFYIVAIRKRQSLR